MPELSTKPRDQLALYRTTYQKSYKVSYKDKIRSQNMWLLLNIISLISMRSFFVPGSPHTKPYSGTFWSLWLTQRISKLISDLLFFLFVELSLDKEKRETPSQKHIQVHTCIFLKNYFSSNLLIWRNLYLLQGWGKTWMNTLPNSFTTKHKPVTERKISHDFMCIRNIK